jgi:hypothetical protein
MAVRYFRLAAEQGHLAGQYHLANALEKGLGCEVQLEEASMWFERAAANGCRTSHERLQRLLARSCLENGLETSESGLFLGAIGHCAPAA